MLKHGATVVTIPGTFLPHCLSLYVFRHVCKPTPCVASFPGSSPAFCRILYDKKLGRSLGTRLHLVYIYSYPVTNYLSIYLSIYQSIHQSQFGYIVFAGYAVQYKQIVYMTSCVCLLQPADSVPVTIVLGSIQCSLCVSIRFAPQCPAFHWLINWLAVCAHHIICNLQDLSLQLNSLYSLPYPSTAMAIRTGSRIPPLRDVILNLDFD